MDEIKYRRPITCYLYLVSLALLLHACNSDLTVNLGDGYFYRYEGNSLRDIHCERARGGEIPATVLAYDYDDDFIIAKQVPNLEQDPLYDIEYQYERGTGVFYYWLIVKDGDLVFGPMGIGMFDELRVKFDVPNSLTLE